MVYLVVACFLLLAVMGVWYYHQCSGSKWPPERVNKNRLFASGTLTPALKKYLTELKLSELAEVLADKAGKMSPGLLEETAAFLAAGDRSGDLVSLIESPDVDEREQAAEILGYIPLPGGPEALVKALGDKNEAVGLAAGASLVRFKDPSTAQPLAQSLGHPGKLLPARVAEVLLALGEKAVMPLIDEIRKADSEGQPLICEVLGQLGDARALPVLTEILKESPYEKTRAAAARALGAIPGQDNAQALMESLEDSSWEVRAKAAEALGELGSNEALQALQTVATEDEDWNVKAVAQAALKKLTC